MTETQPTACRSCGYRQLQTFLSLGRTPLANALLTEKQLTEPEETYPLDLAFCSACTLVQLTESVSPEKLFREYVYFSSFSDTMLRHAEDLSSGLLGSCHLGAESLVIEVASNDGYLLRYYKRAGVPVLGIEPAVNIARVSEQEHGIPTVCDFFNQELASRLVVEGYQADVIHANNVLAHVPDLNGFVSGLRTLLKDKGIVVVEVPYVKDMIDRVEFDTVYHEHLSYFSLTALDALFTRNGLTIQKVERLPVHGGTLRLYAGYSFRKDESVSQLLRDEEVWGAGDIDFYSGFGSRVEQLRREVVTLLRELKAQDKRIAVYGASAKGSTLLNYCGVGRETLDYVVDRSTVKQGLYTPGTHLKIYAPEKLLEDMPDYVLLLTWNFASEILKQQAEYRRRGGRFIVPIPSVRVV
ncbi:MAG TPA: class I SAM-dependent methyltransferase [Pyrinomonadaceae bacterium]|nr:class I SAM-dependent methyltransferase [Pyrinomonadaceae bacterium]